MSIVLEVVLQRLLISWHNTTTLSFNDLSCRWHILNFFIIKCQLSVVSKEIIHLHLFGSLVKIIQQIIKINSLSQLRKKNNKLKTVHIYVKVVFSCYLNQCRMARDYDHLFKLLIIGDSGEYLAWDPSGRGLKGNYIKILIKLKELSGLLIASLVHIRLVD